MKSVFVVTEGRYSDYGIEAVFSTRELAELYVQRHDQLERYRQDWDIIEWEVDDWDKREMPRMFWSMWVNLETGVLRGKHKSQAMALPRSRVPQNYRITTKVLKGAEMDNQGRREVCVGSFVSLEHAEKLAVEARQKWLRMKGESESAATRG